MHERKLIKTEDGSFTIFIPEWNESYHSKHGAVREAIHVFIENGLNKIESKKQLSVLEIGFGTGLNAFLTYLAGNEQKVLIDYSGIEKYPLDSQEYELLGYQKAVVEFVDKSIFSETELNSIYLKIMMAEWNEFQVISQNFRLRKIQADFLEFNYPENEFDLVYFDAFGARVQPELWTEKIFSKICCSMKTGGLLTTYSSKGSVRRALTELGFEVEKLAGPPGKREMINAVKK